VCLSYSLIHSDLQIVFDRVLDISLNVSMLQVNIYSLTLHRIRRRIQHTEQMFCVCGWHNADFMHMFKLAPVFSATAMKDCFG